MGFERIDDKRLYENKPSGQGAMPARLQGSIRAGNTIQLYSFGLKDVMLSFGPGMIDFTKPLTIRTRKLAA